MTSGGIDMMLATQPLREPALRAGPVLFTEDRLLAVSARHPIAKRASVAFADLARDKVLRSPPAVPDHWDESLAPCHMPDGRPVERGPMSTTIQEMLALVAYLPIDDQDPFEWALFWPIAAETSRVRAFNAIAAQVATSHDSAGWLPLPRPSLAVRSPGRQPRMVAQILQDSGQLYRASKQFSWCRLTYGLFDAA